MSDAHYRSDLTDIAQFQYMALYNYSFHIRKRWKSAQQKQSSMEAAYSKERKERRHVENDLQEALQRVRSLERTEAQLKKWEDRKPMIERETPLADSCPP